MNESKKNKKEIRIFSYLKDYYEEKYENFRAFSDVDKKLESPDIQNEIDSIGVEIVQVTVEEMEKRYSYLNKLRKNEVRDKNQYKDIIIYYGEKPNSILAPIIISDSSFKWEKDLIIKTLKAKLKKLPEYKQFKTNTLLVKMSEYIDFRNVKKSEFFINSNFKSWIKEAEHDFEKVFDEYIFLSLIMKKIYIFCHNSNGDFIYSEKTLPTITG